MAMGANNGLLLTDDAFEGSDGKGIATILKGAVEKKQTARIKRIVSSSGYKSVSFNLY